MCMKCRNIYILKYRHNLIRLGFNILQMVAQLGLTSSVLGSTYRTIFSAWVKHSANSGTTWLNLTRLGFHILQMLAKPDPTGLLLCHILYIHTSRCMWSGFMDHFWHNLVSLNKHTEKNNNIYFKS